VNTTEGEERPEVYAREAAGSEQIVVEKLKFKKIGMERSEGGGGLG
jgi:hypothetical protein